MNCTTSELRDCWAANGLHQVFTMWSSVGSKWCTLLIDPVFQVGEGPEIDADHTRRHTKHARTWTESNTPTPNKNSMSKDDRDTAPAHRSERPIPWFSGKLSNYCGTMIIARANIGLQCNVVPAIILE